MLDSRHFRVGVVMVLALVGVTGCGATRGGAAVVAGGSSAVTTSTAAVISVQSAVTTDAPAVPSEPPAATSDSSTADGQEPDPAVTSDDPSSADDGSAPAGGVDACKLLTDEEISAVIGDNSGGKGGSGSCSWENESNYHSVSVTIGDAGSAQDGKLPDPLPGATTSDGPNGIRYSSGNVAEFLVGDRACHIQVVTSPTDESDRPTAVRLIGLIRSRLGS